MNLGGIVFGVVLRHCWARGGGGGVGVYKRGCGWFGFWGRGYSSTSSANDFIWVIFLTTLHSLVTSIFVPSLGGFEDATARGIVYPMQETQPLLTFHYFGSSFVRQWQMVLVSSAGVPAIKDVMYILYSLKKFIAFFRRCFAFVVTVATYVER